MEGFPSPPNSGVRPLWLAQCIPDLPDLARGQLCLDALRHRNGTSNGTGVGMDLFVSLTRHHLRTPTNITGEEDIVRG